MNAAWGIIALIIGFSTWFAPPGWNGFWVPASADVTVGDSRIIASIFIAAGMVIFGLSRGK